MSYEEKVVFIEGNEIPIKALLKDRDENIKKLGERGLVLDLALKKFPKIGMSPKIGVL